MYEKDFRMSLFDKTTAEIVATKDSDADAGRRPLPDAGGEPREGKERAGANYRLGPPYAEALLAKAGGLVSPDANSTLRVTYGTVKGVEPRDGCSTCPRRR